jgi:hypothetical protein
MQDQGIDSLANITLLKDNEINALCKIIWWLGGTNGNKGHSVSQKAEKNLKLCAYLIKHWTKCLTQPYNLDTNTLDNIHSMFWLTNSSRCMRTMNLLSCRVFESPLNCENN